MRLAIADPPYPPQYSERRDLADGGTRVVSRSRARRYYGDGPRSGDERPADFHPDAGEWDDPVRHRALLEQLRDEFDGWAIATCPDGLDHYRPLPIPARLMVWRKLRPAPTAHRIGTSWEPVILYPPEGRRAHPRSGTGQTPDVLEAVPLESLEEENARLRALVAELTGSTTPDVLTAAAPRLDFPGAKPPAWTRWVLDALGYDPDVDELVDLFPGSGAVATAAAQGVLL